MSTSTIVAILVFLLAIGGSLLFGGSANAPETHVMPDGTIMKNSDPVMKQNEEAPSIHTRPDDTIMMDSDSTMTAPVKVPSAPEAQVDHSIMGHSM